MFLEGKNACPPCVPVLMLQKGKAHDSQAPDQTSSHRSPVGEGPVETVLVAFLAAVVEYLAKGCLRE